MSAEKVGRIGKEKGKWVHERERERERWLSARKKWEEREGVNEDRNETEDGKEYSYVKGDKDGVKIEGMRVYVMREERKGLAMDTGKNGKG